MSDELQETVDEPQDGLQELVLDEPSLEMRSASKRELDMLLVPWNTIIHHDRGPEMFERGAFSDVNPAQVRLTGPDSRGNHEGPVVGKGMDLQERDDGAYMTFKVSKTVHGDELLTLVADGVVTGASMSFFEVPGGTSIQQRGGQRLRVQKRVGLDHVVSTWRPAYEKSAVVGMRSKIDEVAPVSELETKAPETGATEGDANERIAAALEQFQERSKSNDSLNEKLIERMEKLEERDRSNFVVPGTPEPTNKPKLHEWASAAARMLVGGRIDPRELQERALQDVVSPDNPGQIPEAFVNDILGIVTARRPFLASTTQISAPAVGLSMTVPVFDQHSTVGVQSEEKSDIDSTAMKVTTDSFDAITIAGGADVSIQLIRRGEPSFFDLLIRDLGAAYAASADIEAISALLGKGVTSGAADLDPENLMVGDAWANSISAIGEAPDHVWLSSAAVAEFIDAKDNGTNRPLYFNLNANFAAGTGTGGNVSALQPVYVPALDSSGVDVLIGPASGFVWAEDGTFQLQVDVPSKAGRDIAVVGILFLVPRYSTAFTSYSLSS
jgi:HK97 family phage major capsid protein